MLGGLGFLAGGTFAWSDEHGGVAGKAHVTRCVKGGRVNRTSSVYCTATWTYKGRAATGYVENGKLTDEGKTLSVRIHGTGHVTKATYWVPIGLWLFGVATLAVAVWFVVLWRRRPQPA